MAVKPNFPLFFSLIIFLIFLVFSATTHAKRNIPNSSHFDLETYLTRFGYLDHHTTLKSAIKTFQQNFGINPTGTLDAQTLSQMQAPRCGVPDIINGINYMKRRRNVSSPHYAFYSDNEPKWGKFELTYKFLEEFPEFAKRPLELALEKWANVSKFTFSEEKRSFLGGDLNIGFYRGDHGDGFPFDGRGGYLAHAFRPPDGRLHFDLDENWFRHVYRSNRNSYHIDTVALHEIGHALGLGHSAIKAAVMYPSIRAGEIRDALDEDDIEGIEDLYDFNIN